MMLMPEYCCDEFKYECNKEFDPIEYRKVYYNREGYHDREGYVFTYEGQTTSPPLNYCPFCGKKL
jgi:hypothetical protein